MLSVLTLLELCISDVYAAAVQVLLLFKKQNNNLK